MREKPSAAPIGGGGTLPSRIARRNARPLRPAEAAAVRIGSCHSMVRERWVMIPPAAGAAPRIAGSAPPPASRGAPGRRRRARQEGIMGASMPARGPSSALPILRPMLLEAGELPAEDDRYLYEV